MDTPATLILREAIDDDLPVVGAVLRAAFGEHMLKRMEGGRVVVALLGAELVGCAVYEPNDEHVYLGRVAVLSPHRHHGVGGALVAYVEERARRLGTPRVRLAARADEPQLHEWYASAGYRLCEECFFPGIDEPMYIILEKDLAR
jgi:GNAT superfamily N-acetyltransferase